MHDQAQVIRAVRQWVETVVVDLNLCPFAKPELKKERIRFFVSQAETEIDLLMDLEAELKLLETETSIETTLLIHPEMLEAFLDYNQFLNLADGLVRQMGLDGVYQIASFHPDYQFGGTQAGDAENFTNRSPYPMLHLLRENSLDRVLATTEHAEKIPERNIELMKKLGVQALRERLDKCFTPKSEA